MSPRQKTPSTLIPCKEGAQKKFDSLQIPNQRLGEYGGRLWLFTVDKPRIGFLSAGPDEGRNPTKANRTSVSTSESADGLNITLPFALM